MAKKQPQQADNVPEKEQEKTPKEEIHNLAIFTAPRLPYHPAIQERFGIDKSDWMALTTAIYPNAQTTESVVLALSYCKARKLDPFKRCIHIVPIWDNQKRCLVDTVWPGIGELRTTAHRTKNYAGRDKTEFGPMMEQTWGSGNESVTVKFPEWAQVTVYRNVKGQRVAYAGSQVYWLETYGSHKNGAPNSMWQKRPRGQIDKCAEASALRSAFPEEVGNDYIDAEAHLSREVESREVKKDVESGVTALKDRLAEREKKQNGGNSEDEVVTDQQIEDAIVNANSAGPEPVDPDERLKEVNEKINQQKEKLVSVGSGSRKSNLF